MVSAEARCAHLPPQRGQTNLEHSKFVSEAYLSNVSLDKDRMPHNLQPGLENNLRDCLQSKWKDFFLSEETTLHQGKRKISEVDSLPKMLDPTHDNL